MPLYDFNELVKNASEAKPRQAINFEPLEPGDYEFVINELPEINHEKHYLKVKAQVATGERAKYTHFHFVSFKPGLAPYGAKQTVDFLTATGLTPEQITKSQSWEDIANFLVNKHFVASVTQEDDDYRNNNRAPGDTKEYKRNRLNDFRAASIAPAQGVPNGLGGPQAPGLGQGAPNVSQGAPGVPQTAPQAAPQPDPWSTPPAQQAAPQATPQTNFQAPPMPFGN